MKRMVLVFIVFALLLVLTAGAREAEADGFISPTEWYIYQPIEFEPVDAYWIPPIYHPPPEKAYPEVEYHEVTVVIDENYAVTEVDQEFHNPYDADMRGMYIFPVPHGAAISNFELIIDGESYQAILMDGDEASQLLDEAIADNRDASLLEFKERDLFTYEIFIPAHESRQVCLRYEELVPMRDGYYHYIYTLGTEQYSSALIDFVSIDITMRTRSGFEEVYSPTHDVTIRRDEWRWDEQDGVDPEAYLRLQKEVGIFYEEENARPDIDLEICYSKFPGKYDGELFTNSTDEEGHFLFTFTPSADLSDDRILPKDVIFVVDQSSSMDGKKLDQTILALKGMLDQLTDVDRFTILNYNAHVGWYSDGLMRVTDWEIRMAKRYIDTLTNQGGTDIEQAILKALSIHRGAQLRDAQRMIIFLTDGRPTSGVREDDLILDHIDRANRIPEGDVRIFTFGIGPNVNSDLLEGIAHGNHGESVFILRSDQIEPAITGFFEGISDPVLTDIRVEFSGPRVFGLYPSTIPDVYMGSQLLLCGRFIAVIGEGDTIEAGGGGSGASESGLFTITITGRGINGERSFSFTFDTTETGEYEFVQRVWAIREIDSLIGSIRMIGEKPGTIDRIRQLGIEYGIVTPYTSFLAEVPPVEVIWPGFPRPDLEGPIYPINANSNVDGSIENRLQDVITDRRITMSETYGGSYELFLPLPREIQVSPFPPMTIEEKFMDVETGSEEFYVLPETRAYQHPWTRTIQIGVSDFYVRNLAIHDEESSVSIIWDTTRKVEGGIFYRQLGTREWDTFWSGRTSLEHMLNIQELPEGWYEFSICLMDENGNLIIDDNEGIYHQFVIGEPNVPHIDHLYIETTSGISISWRTTSPLRSTVYYRRAGGGEFLNLELRLVNSDVTLDHSIRKHLETGEYEFFIASIDGDDKRFVDNNGGEYYSFSIEESQGSSSLNKGDLDSPYLLMLGIIIGGGLLMLGTLMRREHADLLDISSEEALNRHISRFTSDSPITNDLIQLLLKKQLQSDRILSNAFTWISTATTAGTAMNRAHPGG